MSRLEKVALLIGIIWGLLGIANYVAPNLPILSSILVWMPYQVKWFIIGVVSLGILISVVRAVRSAQGSRSKRTPRPIDPRFAHLKVDYSHISDTPYAPIPPRQGYVTNIKTKEAYWIPTTLEPYIKQCNINWRPHDGEMALKACFKQNKIHPNEHDPELDDLGLSLSRDNLLQLPDLDLDRLLTKLGGKKINGVTILKIYPWYRYFGSKPYYTNKRLLLKYSTQKNEKSEVFFAPFHDLDLIDKGLIDFETKSKMPFETLKRWSTRSGYIYVGKRYDETELLGD